jgi:hypothetical protein
MDDLDRLHRRMIQNIRATRPEYLQIPFTVRELYEQIVPYRHNRRELAIETNDDYETAIARLLSGERGYVQSDPAMQDALRRELTSPTGDPGLFKEYADATLTLAPVSEAIRTPLPPGVPAADRPSIPVAAPRDATAVATPPHPPSHDVTAAFDAIAPAMTTPSATPTVPALLESLTSNAVPTGCRFCGGTLPEGRDSNYCPHCGENLRTRRCAACGAEMDSGWKFCVTCGARAS